jgi:hypothetical protein
VAQLLAFAPADAAEQAIIGELDKNVATFGRGIQSHCVWISWLLRLIRRYEIFKNNFIEPMPGAVKVWQFLFVSYHHSIFLFKTSSAAPGH